MPSKTNNRSLLLLGAAAAFLILFAYYSFVLKPTSEALDRNKAEIATLQSQNRILEKKAQDKEKAGDSMPADELQAALPPWDNIEQLTNDFYEIGKATEVKVNSLSFVSSAKNDFQTLLGSKDPVYTNVKAVEVKATVAGKYDKVQEVVGRLQKLSRLTHVTSVDYGTLTIDKNSALPVDPGKEITVNLAFKAYYDASKETKESKDAKAANGAKQTTAPAAGS